MRTDLDKFYMDAHKRSVTEAVDIWALSEALGRVRESKFTEAECGIDITELPSWGEWPGNTRGVWSWNTLNRESVLILVCRYETWGGRWHIADLSKEARAGNRWAIRTLEESGCPLPASSP